MVWSCLGFEVTEHKPQAKIFLLMVDFEFRPFSQLPTVVKVLILLLVANSHGMTC